MTIFSDDPKPVDTQNANPAQVTTLVDELVGEGKKFKTVEDLAKGKQESDTFITELQAKLTNAEAELQKQDYASELLATLQDKTAQLEPNPVVNSLNTNDQPALSAEDLKSLVETTLSEREQSAITSSNLKAVEDAMTKAYGTEASVKVKEKATELGMSVEDLQTIASKSPSLFLQTMGQPPQQADPMVSSTVHTDNLNLSSTKRDSTFYRKLRKENPDRYRSATVQAQMFDDRVALGDSFYNS
jgi:hypothetical protein